MKNKKISVLAFENGPALGTTGPLDILSMANSFWMQIHGSDQPYFVTEFIGNRVEEFLETHRDLIDWLSLQHAKGISIASFCTGTFLAASAGVLKGKRATTNWYFESLFREKFPDVELVPEKIVVDDSDTYTAGSATAFLNLTLYLIEKFCGHQLSLMTSKMMLIDTNKTSQYSYAIFRPQKNHNHENILKAQEHLELNFNKSIKISELADLANMSLRNFTRKFKKATGNTPIEYLQRIRIEHAKKALESQDTNILQIAYHSGYSDYQSFRAVFKKWTTLSPRQYRLKHQRTVQ